MYVLFLHGPAAAGKHTIGSLVSEALGVPLFHNHLTVDLVATLFPFGSEGFVTLRSDIWLTSFREAARAGQSFVFTFNPESTVDPSLIQQLEEVVSEAGGKVHFIELQCSRETVLERLDSESRAKFGKLRDKELYKTFEAQGGFDFPPLPTPLVTVDTEALSPEESCALICEAVRAL